MRHFLRRNAGRLAILLATVFLSTCSQAYVVIQLGPGVPESAEQALLQATSAQFTVDTFVNPFFPNTYALTLHGLNPSYNPPLTNAQLIQLLPQYPFGAGMMYERTTDAGHLGSYMGLCNSATSFNLISIDSTTCQGVLGFMDNFLVTQTSGVAVIPNPLPGL